MTGAVLHLIEKWESNRLPEMRCVPHFGKGGAINLAAKPSL